MQCKRRSFSLFNNYTTCPMSELSRNSKELQSKTQNFLYFKGKNHKKKNVPLKGNESTIAQRELKQCENKSDSWNSNRMRLSFH